MSRPTTKKNQHTLLKFIMLVVIVLVGQNLLRIPRTRWSAKDSSRDAATMHDVIRGVTRPKDISRVVLISLDTLRADHLGCYGYSRNTSSNIDALAGESILFQHAISPMPLTLPAHSSMMTGTNPYHHQVHDNINSHLGPSNITLAEILKENGFVTGAIIGAFALDAQFGLDQGFDTYNDALDNSQQLSEFLPFSNERPAEEVTRLAGQWFEEHQAERSFLFVHYYDPHFPYLWHENTPFKYPFLFQSYNDRYDSEIAYTDRWLGVLIDGLKQLGLYDSTLIIVVGDHGESLQDHREGAHGFFIYHSSIHVPLIIKLPGFSTGMSVNEVVSIIDIVPTVCQLLGIDPPAQVEGQDLFANTRRDNDRALYCESLTPTTYNGASLTGLVSDRYKYIRTARPELYDMYEDPRETENVIGEHPAMAAAFEDLLLRMIRGRPDYPAESRIPLDEETRQRLATLGYIGGVIETDYEITAAKEDPKDIIEFYENWQKMYLWIAAKQYSLARDHVLDVITERPHFCDTLMSTVAYALATDSDPAVRDPDAAITIARHGAEVTKYRDQYSLKALTAAYQAAGRREEATRTALILLDLVAEKEKQANRPEMPGGHTPDANSLDIHE